MTSEVLAPQEDLVMGTLYLTTPDTILHKVDERLQVRQHREVLLDLPMIKVDQVVSFGRVTMTAAAVEALIKRKIGICYLTVSGRYVGRVEPEFSKNVLLRVEQYRAAFDPARRAYLASRFVRGKLANMRVALARLQRERAHEDLADALLQVKQAERGARQADDVDSIRGYEGSASAAYFGVFHHFLKADGFTFTRRLRRPPPDPVNALLSLGYAIMRHDLQTACNLVGFDAYLGFLHTDRYGRASLALDLMEEFRALVVDATVLRCINLRMVTPDDFQEDLGSVRLTENGLKTFLRAYEERKQTTIKHPALGIKVNYQRCFELQARLLARYLTGEIGEYLPLIVQ